MKFTVGFQTQPLDPMQSMPRQPVTGSNHPCPCLVAVQFPHRNLTCTYFNDRFELHPGDRVYVEGKLEGHMGQVTHVDYNFKIKLSQYKKVIGMVETRVKGSFIAVGNHLLTRDAQTLPYEQARTWFLPPDTDEEPYVSYSDGEHFPLQDLTQFNVDPEVAQEGHEIYMEDQVVYWEVDHTKGRAIVNTLQPYEIEFTYQDGQISNLTCGCYHAGVCMHRVAAILQLRESLSLLEQNKPEWLDEEYLAAVEKDTFVEFAMHNQHPVNVTLE